jgi:hypothetical protein
MAKPRETVDCTLCGDKAVPRSREDVIPRWLAEKLAYFARQHHPGQEATYEDYSYERLSDFGAPNYVAARKIGDIPTAF